MPAEHRTVFGLDRRPLGPTILIAAVAFFFAIVLPAINRSVSPEDPIEPGTVFDVGLGVSFTPRSGWSLDAPQTKPGTPVAGGTFVVSESGLLYSVTSENFEGSLDEFMTLADDRVDKQLDAFAPSSPFESVRTEQGITGLSELYTGASNQGVLTVLLVDGVGVTVSADGPRGTLAQQSQEVDDMTRSIVMAGGDEQDPDDG